MTEKELRFTCAYTDCGKETTVIVTVAKPLATQSKGVPRVYYCEHCNRANRIPIPDNVDVHQGFTLFRRCCAQEECNQWNSW